MALPAKILVVRLGAIGDVTNALVFATALRDLEPNVQIGWVTHELAQPLVVGHPALARAHVWPRGGGARGLRQIVQELRGERYDLAVDLQRLQKSAFLARRSGAPRVLGFHRTQVKEQSWIWTNERIAPHAPRAHMVERYLAAARHLGAHGPARHELPLEPASEAWAQRELDRLGAAPIVISVGATKPENRWPAERFGTLAKRLAAHFERPVCFSGGPQEKAAAEAALRAAGEANTTNYAGSTNLSQLIALLRRSALFVGCDTGPMHLAVACGARTVALFGPAEPWRTGPYGAQHRVVRVPPYNRTSPDLSPATPRPRTDAIQVDDVVAAVEDLQLER